MVEVAYNREHLLELVKRWVKPVEEVKKYMEEVMERCERAPDRYLALKLPVKGSVMAADAGEVAGLEALALQERERVREREKVGKSVKYVKKNSVSGSGGATPVGKKDGKAVSVVEAVKHGANGTSASSVTSAQVDGSFAGVKKEETDTSGKDAVPANGEKKEDQQEASTESGRPRRTTRKSVRISEL